MANNFDLLLTGNDLAISENGDFFIGESDVQHVVDTINCFPGWWKENVADGVGLMAFSKSASDMSVLNRSIKMNLTADGYDVTSPVIELSADGQLFINPNAVKR